MELAKYYIKEIIERKRRKKNRRGKKGEGRLRKQVKSDQGTCEDDTKRMKTKKKRRKEGYN